MRSHALYEPFDRVWVRMDGYDWWPGRIVSDAELQANDQIRPEGCDITVYFYEGTTTPASLEHFQSAVTDITFFETSSEKAVTADADRLAAIRRAEGDETANPLKYEFAAVAERSGANKTGDTAGFAHDAPTGRRTAGDAARQQRSAGKRGRDADWEDGRGFSSSSQVLPDEKLIDIAERINAAVAAVDFPTLRIELCDLDSVRVTLRQLELTKIGVAVGSILGHKGMAKLWPLARAIISAWARAMPVETIEAIKQHQQYRRGKQDDNDNHACTVERDARSPDKAPAASSFINMSNTASSPAPHSAAAGAERIRERFVDRVRKLLENPADPLVPSVSSADLDAVAEELCQDVVELEDRKYLQEQLEKPGMAQLRRDLATRALTGREFLTLPRSRLMTDDERRMDEERITKIINDQEKLELANVAVTTLFKCPNCGKNRCSFYEQQTRSADEPTTKFLRCLECKYSWTTE